MSVSAMEADNRLSPAFQPVKRPTRDDSAQALAWLLRQLRWERRLEGLRKRDKTEPEEEPQAA